ncbi:MAG: efflux RND transporter periplasmic adaptor subunit [Deltaproteobacteria bacterium]|nr:efflux RND transporter periplasmic adaptor subunit [Deltaproteobacteria bacterium]
MTEQSRENESGKVAPANGLPRRTLKQRFFAVGLIVVLLTAGTLAARFIIRSRPRVKKRPPSEMVTLVTAVKVFPEDRRIEVRAQGRMIPAKEIVLQARVTGTVVYLHPQLVPGGIIGKSEILLKLDDTDYRLNFKRMQDALALEEANLRLEEGSQNVARQEWDLIRKLGDEIGGKVDESSRDLALRKPQLAKVKARIASARTALEKARVDLERCTIRAPFNLVVRSENVDIGSEITTATKIATLAATDRFWAEISLPVAKLDRFDLPRPGEEGGSPVRVISRNGRSWSGKIVSLAPDLDENGLMARILVAVDDPLGLKSGHRPLLLGSFVKAVISGKLMAGVFRVPRSALRENETLFLVNEKQRLHHQTVHVAWKNLENVFVDRGLNPGDRVITSTLAAPVEGMLLRVVAGVTDDSGETPAAADSSRQSGAEQR